MTFTSTVTGYRFEIFRISNLDLSTRNTYSTVPFTTMDEVRGMLKLFLTSLPKSVFMAADLDPRYKVALRFATVSSEHNKLIDAMLVSENTGVIVNTQHVNSETTMYDIIRIVPIVESVPMSQPLQKQCTACKCICDPPENPDGTRTCSLYGKYY